MGSFVMSIPHLRKGRKRSVNEGLKQTEKGKKLEKRKRRRGTQGLSKKDKIWRNERELEGKGENRETQAQEGLRIQSFNFSFLDLELCNKKTGKEGVLNLRHSAAMFGKWEMISEGSLWLMSSQTNFSPLFLSWSSIPLATTSRGANSPLGSYRCINLSPS